MDSCCVFWWKVLGKLVNMYHEYLHLYMFQVQSPSPTAMVMVIPIHPHPIPSMGLVYLPIFWLMFMVFM